MRRIMWLVIAFLGLVTAAGAEDASVLIERMIAAYGGHVALEKIAAIRQEGKVEATMRVGSSGPIVCTYARPSKLCIQIGEGPKFTEVRVLNGAKGWRNGQESTGVSYESMVLQAARLDIPWLLMKHKTKLVDKGPMERDGRRRIRRQPFYELLFCMEASVALTSTNTESPFFSFSSRTERVVITEDNVPAAVLTTTSDTTGPRTICCTFPAN